MGFSSVVDYSVVDYSVADYSVAGASKNENGQQSKSGEIKKHRRWLADGAFARAPLLCAGEMIVRRRSGQLARAKPL
jgi:hypothetical protein